MSAANFRTDVNANGSINASEVSLVKSRSGGSIPLVTLPDFAKRAQPRR